MSEDGDEIVEPLIDEEEVTYDADVAMPEETLSDILTRVVRPGWRPEISHLPDAVIDGKLMVNVGDKLLIQYPDLYRDTICWIIQSIFHEVREGYTVEAGHLGLYDKGKMHQGCTNYLTAASYGLVLKVPDKKRKWIPGEDETLMERKGKRRRRFVLEEEPEPETRPLIPGSDEPIKKRRGRPPGSKNKTRVIQTIPKSPETKKVNAA